MPSHNAYENIVNVLYISKITIYKVVYLALFSYLYTMKKDNQIVEELLENAKYLQALDDIKPKAAVSLSDSKYQDLLDQLKEKDAQIESLKSSLDGMKNTLDTLTLTVKELNKTNISNQKQNAKLLALVEKLTKELDTYKARMGRSNQETFGSKSLTRKYKATTKKTRTEEKEDWTSKDDDKKNPPSAPGISTEGINQEKVTSENLGPRGARPCKYNRMNAAKVIYLETTLDTAPENMIFKGYREVEEYTRKSYVECTVFKVALYENEAGDIHEHYCPADPSDTRRPHENVIPSTHCTPEFLADLAIEHFMMFIPYYREQIRHGLGNFSISKNTNRNWVNKGAELLKPIIGALRNELLAKKSYLNIDETWTKVRIKFKQDGSKLGKYFKKYVWVIVNKAANITFFLYDNEENDSRGKRPIETFLGGYSGSVHSDGYTVYKHLTLSEGELIHIMCWAHVRAKFEQAFRYSKDLNADWFVKKIGELYRIEAECIIAHMDAAQIKERRNRPDVDQILKELLNKCSELLSPDSNPNTEMMEKALKYLFNNWDDLIRYRHDGRYSIDNLAAERAVRPFTVARKNSLHFSSEEGVSVAMVYHTLIETCKNIGLNVKSYFEYVFKRLRDNKSHNPDELVPAVVLKNLNS